MTTKQRSIPNNAATLYQEQGYYLAKGVLPASLLNLCQAALENWVDRQAQNWCSEGKVGSSFSDLDFMHRFTALWDAAGKPKYDRSPRRSLVEIAPREMYQVLKHEALLNLAQAFLGTGEIVSHGVWNSRPKTPKGQFTNTPWHQDGQYFREQAHLHILTIWFPLHAVDADSGCLAVSPNFHNTKLYQNFEYPENGFTGISREDAMNLPCHPVDMEPGDALCFSQLTPHRAMPNAGDAMRWSMDMRFVATEQAMAPALDFGMVARSEDASTVTTYDEWIAKWATE
ncbi:MAG: phytanoyl-CoA dioxygenase family protein [Verrucomicrobiota bacterium]